MRTAKEYVTEIRRIARLRRALDRREAAAHKASNQIPFPKKVRQARASDIKVGAILWFDYGGNRGFHIVDEVLNPSDEWKGFVAMDGSRYGLDGTFVEVKS